MGWRFGFECQVSTLWSNFYLGAKQCSHRCLAVGGGGASQHVSQVTWPGGSASGVGMGVCQAGCGGGRLGRPPPARTRKASGMHPMLFFNFMHPSEILANIELVPNRIILDPQLSVQKFACDYSALRRVRSLVRNPLCEYATLLNLVEFKQKTRSLTWRFFFSLMVWSKRMLLSCFNFLIFWIQTLCFPVL